MVEKDNIVFSGIGGPLFGPSEIKSRNYTVINKVKSASELNAQKSQSQSNTETEKQQIEKSETADTSSNDEKLKEVLEEVFELKKIIASKQKQQSESKPVNNANAVTDQDKCIIPELSIGSGPPKKEKITTEQVIMEQNMDLSASKYSNIAGKLGFLLQSNKKDIEKLSNGTYKILISVSKIY